MTSDTDETLTVWGRATSSHVQVVMWCIGELGLPHRRIDAGGAFGGLDSAAFRAMNPNGRIPVMREGAFVLYESHAIVRYLAAKHGGDAFWPADLRARARIDRWMDWVKTALNPDFTYRVFWGLWRTPEAERDMDDIARGLAATHAAMRIAEAALEPGPFLEGDALTPADLAFGMLLYRYYTLSIERPDLPRLAGYYGRLCERPAYRTHVMVPYDSLKA